MIFLAIATTSCNVQKKEKKNIYSLEKTMVDKNGVLNETSAGRNAPDKSVFGRPITMR